VLRTRNFHQFTDSQAIVKNFLQLFFAAIGFDLTKSADEKIS